MRRIFVIICLLLSAMSLSAQTTANEWLASLEASLGNRYAYTISVNVDMSESQATLDGRVMVEGDSYYMSLEAMEVYSDGKLRYEVNNQRKEVTEDRVDLESRDLLTNPTRAFRFAPEEFQLSLRYSHNDEVAVVDLTPRDTNLGITAISLSLVREGGKVYPRQIAYDYDGDSVVIAIGEYEAGGWTLPKWSKTNYKAYDIVSFL
jgi:hypothetical protein